MAASSESNKKPALREPGFEECFDEVELIVSQLEAGDKPLEETMALYEKAVSSLRRCHVILDKAEKRILLLKNAGGKPELEESPMPVPKSSGRQRSSEGKPEKKSEQQSIDSQPSVSENAPSSSHAKDRTQNGNPAGGGSLFGTTQ